MLIHPLKHLQERNQKRKLKNFFKILEIMKNKYSEPNSEGFFGSYGGKFVPETLMEALDELEKCYEDIKSDSEFQKKLIGIWLILLAGHLHFILLKG